VGLNLRSVRAFDSAAKVQSFAAFLSRIDSDPDRALATFTPAGMLPRNRPGHKGVGHWRNGDAKGQQARAIGPATPRGALVSALPHT
jgi:hypothetical protein